MLTIPNEFQQIYQVLLIGISIFFAVCLWRRQRLLAACVLAGSFIALIVNGMIATGRVNEVDEGNRFLVASMTCLSYVALGLSMVAPFLNRTAASSDERGSMSLTQIVMTTSVACVILTLMAFNWLGYPVLPQSLRAFQPDAPWLLAHVLMVGTAVTFISRFPRSMVAVLLYGIFQLTVSLLGSFGRPSWQPLPNSVEILASLVLWYGTFAERGLRKQLPWLTLGFDRLNEAEKKLVMRSGLAFAMLWPATLLPWMSGFQPASIVTTGAEGDYFPYVTAINMALLNGWRIQMVLGTVEIPMAKATLACAFVATCLAWLRTKPVIGWLPQLASLTGFLLMVTFMAIIAWAPVFGIRIGALLATGVFMIQLWPVRANAKSTSPLPAPSSSRAVPA